MNSGGKKAGKELYQQLRVLSWEQLWTGEVPRFDKASPQERSDRVAVVRAVGVVFRNPATQKTRKTSSYGFAGCSTIPARRCGVMP